MKENINTEKYRVNGSYFCRCCGYNTLSEFPNGTYEICGICFWEDDHYQTLHPHYMGSPNRVSLHKGRLNFNEYGSCEVDMVHNCRKPTEKEVRINPITIPDIL